MIILLSPAKSLNYAKSKHDLELTMPLFIDKTSKLVKLMKNFSAKDLSKLMKISDSLGELNAQRYKNWDNDFSDENTKASILTFNGDVYSGLDAESLTKTELNFAQKHIIILSGLYGCLSPFDKLQAYRLEMGTKLKIHENIDNLYQYWANDITCHINNLKEKYVINLASEEYSKVIDRKILNKNIIDVKFYDEKNGKFKIIGFYAKKARGLLARYIIKNKVKSIDELKTFNYEDYFYCEEESSDSVLVFKRYERK